MSNAHAETATSSRFESLLLAEHPRTGTEDDDDDRDAEHQGENEAPIREVDENTEAPEEFEVDNEDESVHPEDDDADEDERTAAR
jgi:hypothetical protein